MDIATTIDVDVDIETERNEAMMKATGMLVTSLTKNGDIPKNTEDKCMNFTTVRDEIIDVDCLSSRRYSSFHASAKMLIVS